MTGTTSAFDTGCLKEAPRARPIERLHFLDTARATMLLLGIPFHASEVYRMSGGFAVASPDTSYVASFVSAAVHGFRMPAFFMLSGFFAAMLLARRPAGPWLKGRYQRLALPLIATTLAIGPLEAAITLMASDNLSWPEAIRAAASLPARKLINHRWFLIVLLLFSCAAAIAQSALSDRTLERWLKPFCATRPWSLAACALLVPLAAVAMGKVFGEILTHSAFLKQYSLLTTKYAFFFGIGYAARRTSHPGAMWGRLSGSEFALASASIAFYLATCFAFYPPGSYGAISSIHPLMSSLVIANEGLTGYFAARLFFRMMHAGFNRKSALISYFVDASFAIYLLHMVFLYMLSARFLALAWLPELEIALISLGCLIASVACYEVARCFKLLSLLLNGELARPRQRLTQQ